MAHHHLVKENLVEDQNLIQVAHQVIVHHRAIKNHLPRATSLTLAGQPAATKKDRKELYGEFNNWTLAAAAYNNGSVKLERAINKQNEDNYFRMSLNRETGSYVYKLIAMKAIIQQPKKYGYDDYFAMTPPTSLLNFN